jgi:hypothetical protein
MEEQTADRFHHFTPQTAGKRALPLYIFTLGINLMSKVIRELEAFPKLSIFGNICRVSIYVAAVDTKL